MSWSRSKLHRSRIVYRHKYTPLDSAQSHHSLRTSLTPRSSPLRNCHHTDSRSRRLQLYPSGYHFDTLAHWLPLYRASPSRNWFPRTRFCKRTCSRLPQAFRTQWRRSCTLSHLIRSYILSRSHNWFPRICSCMHTCSRQLPQYLLVLRFDTLGRLPHGCMATLSHNCHR